MPIQALTRKMNLSGYLFRLPVPEPVLPCGARAIEGAAAGLHLY